MVKVVDSTPLFIPPFLVFFPSANLKTSSSSPPFKAGARSEFKPTPPLPAPVRSAVPSSVLFQVPSATTYPVIFSNGVLVFLVGFPVFFPLVPVFVPLSDSVLVPFASHFASLFLVNAILYELHTNSHQSSIYLTFFITLFISLLFNSLSL
ncbi:hypothetical protein B0T20DRAFT_427471 [Sordaria brevicollis]|uniref:Uncharacterized protein n=1 Tax=Sordaria brevicollis TaxID=83679 RepID=A0AAE0NRF4_SORBR|nr:hypothetical protein B0T20DRAFT_427471 [Sordaria brevicollis]